MLGVVLLGKRAGAAVDEVRLQAQNGLQGDVGLRRLGDGLVLRVPLGVDVGVGVGGGDDLIPQPQGHQLVARVGVGGDDLFGHVGKCDLRAVLGGQGKGKSLGVCRSFRALDIPRRSRAGRRGRILAGGAAGRQAQGEGEGQGYELFMIILLFVLWTEKSRFPTESGTAYRHGHNRTTRRQTDRLLSAEDTYPSAQTAGFLTYGSPPGRAFSCLHNGVCGRLPAYSDRIVRDLHPIPFYPPRRAALSMLSSCRKTYYANFSPLSRGGTLLVQEHPRRVCQGMRRSMLRRRRARWASSSVMPLRAISRSLARSTTSRSSRLRRGGRRAPASSPSRSSSSTAASSSRLPAGAERRRSPGRSGTSSSRPRGPAATPCRSRAAPRPAPPPSHPGTYSRTPRR